MPEIIIAKIYREGRKQSVRIPQQFHFQGNRLHIRKLRGAVLLEPIFSSYAEWIAALDRSQGVCMPDGRFQPETPIRKKVLA